MKTELRKALYSVVGFFGGAFIASRLISNEFVAVVVAIIAAALGYYLASIS